MIGASLQGIVENRVQHPERGRLKQIMKNSDGTAGFSLDIGNPKRLVFAEAPIDLMSYYELHKDELQDVKLVAMDGLKKSVVSRYVADLLTDGKYSQTMSAEQIRGALDALNQTTNLLQEHPDMITLAVDNDEAGRRFVSELQENGIPVVADLPPRQANQEKMDWNDYLKQMKKESIQMVENQEKTGGILPKKNIDGVEQKSLESFSDTQKEAVGELKSYGTFIIDDDFLERRYGSVEHDNSIRTLDSLKENAQQTSISYEDYKQETEKRLDTLYSTDILGQLKAVTDENVDAYKTKGTVEQDRLYQSLKTNQKDLGLAEVSTRFVGEKIIDVENKKSLENLQETVASNSEQQKNERTYQRKGSLQPEAEGSTSPVPEIGTFERSVTSRPTVSSQYLKFTIKNGFKSRKTRVEQSIDAYNLGKLNRRGHDLQEAAQFYLNELANSTIHYFTADNSLVQVNFFENNFMHLMGLKMIGESETPEKVLHDLARGGELSYDDIRIKNTESPFDKLKVLPDLETILQTDSFYFDHLQDIHRYQDRFDSLIKSDDSDLMVLFRMTSEDGTVPVSIFKARQTLSNELQEARKNEIIGIYRERDGQVEQIAINDEYVKDNGEEMRSIIENRQFEEVKVTKTDVTAKKQKAKDSDGDGLTDDEEIALGTNPYSPDTDGDGIIDSIERGSGTDATTPSDTPDNRQKEQMNHNLALSEMIKAKDTAALNQHLQEGIKDYFDSDNYKNFLEGMSHFNNYSVRNIQLIKAQLPEASMVASFNEWKKRNGHVNKGEKALYVQAPVTVIKKDADGNPVINSETGEKETIAYFKPVPVFDVSQVSPVEGKELNLPKMGGGIPEQITKDYYQNVYRSLRDISQKENGVPIRFREFEKSDGFYNPKTNEITIKKGMTYEQTLSTLIHGMAHSELHNKKSLTERFEGKLTRSSKELQAESIAYVVSNHLGFDTSGDSFAYLASWSQEPDGLENLKAQLEIVQEEASSLMKRIDKHLEKYQSLTVSKVEKLTENQKRELSKATNPFYQSLQKAKEESKQVTPANEEQTKKVNRPTKQ